MRYFDLDFLRRSDRGVGRAVDGKTEIPGSSLAAANFFSFLFLIFRICGRQKNSAFAEGGAFFAKKKAPHFI